MTIKNRLARLEQNVADTADDTGPRLESPADFVDLAEGYLRSSRHGGEADLPQAIVETKLALETDPTADREGRKPFLWLLAMLRRIRGGTPAVTIAEFAELATWFEANAERLPRGLIDLGNGQHTDRSNLRCGISEGAKAINAGDVAEALRRLREGCGRDMPTMLQ